MGSTRSIGGCEGEVGRGGTENVSVDDDAPPSGGGGREVRWSKGMVVGCINGPPTEGVVVVVLVYIVGRGPPVAM